jgi:hypothetical protein
MKVIKVNPVIQGGININATINTFRIKIKANTTTIPGQPGQKGLKGDPGDNAYQIAVKYGYTGTEAMWAQFMQSTATQAVQANQQSEQIKQETIQIKQDVEGLATSTIAAIGAAGDAELLEITTLGNAAINAVEAKRVTSIADVDSAGTAEISAIGTAGTTQIGLVTAEGSTQVAAVEAAKDAALDEINPLVTQVTEDAAQTALDVIASETARTGAETARDKSEAWAEGVEPGGTGSKSAKTWAGEAEAARDEIVDQINFTGAVENDVFQKVGQLFVPVSPLNIIKKSVPKMVSSIFWDSSPIPPSTESDSGHTYTLIDGFKTIPLQIISPSSFRNLSIFFNHLKPNSTSQYVYFRAFIDVNNYVELGLTTSVVKIVQCTAGVRVELSSVAFMDATLRFYWRLMHIVFSINNQVCQVTDVTLSQRTNAFTAHSLNPLLFTSFGWSTEFNYIEDIQIKPIGISLPKQL